MEKKYRLLLEGGATRTYATAEARDEAAAEMARLTQTWVGVEDRDENGEWWLVREVKPDSVPQPPRDGRGHIRPGNR